VHNGLELKLGFSREDSDETYLGLSDADFAANPRRRYGASQLDHMKWWRTQLALRHILDFGGGRSVETTVYRHDFDRTWKKVNRTDVGDIGEVLRSPTGGRNALGYKVLTLAPDAPTDRAVFIGPNHRVFISQGVQTLANLRFAGPRVEHRLELGARLHYDRIDRVHTEDAYFAVAGQLQLGTVPTLVNADNRGQSNALALHALDAVTYGGLTLTPGVRFELIRTRAHDRKAGTPYHVEWQNVIIPGLGAYHALHPNLGLLAGAYRGFSPAAPGEGTDVKPETSWNYEAGVRATSARGRAEAIAFFNDYRNLVGVCGIGGCAPEQVDQQFNAGKARIWGVELFGQQQWRPFTGVSVPASLNYTFTRTRLGSTFTSGLAELGTVEEGDEIAYVPRHQAALTLAAETARVGLQAGVSYVSRMREEAGQGDYLPGLTADASLIAELGARVYLLPKAHLYVHVRNLTDAADVAARRPFGARPISPRWVQAGVKAQY
jgi:Fe(3+) dicitrate transport protein